MKRTYKTWAAALACAGIISWGAMPAQALDLGIWGTLAGAAIYYHQLDSTLNHYDTDGREEFFEGLKKKNGVDYDQTKNAMLDAVMSRLSYTVSLSEPSIVERPYLYFINPSQDFNAFCSLGHTMSVNSGVFPILNYNENEIAFVIAHEMVHGQKNHVVQGMRKSFPMEVLQAVYGSQNGGSLGVDILANYASAVYVTKSQEKEADKIAFDYAVGAGYNPGGGAALWQRIIEKMGDNPSTFVGELFAPSDHPENGERRDEYAKRLKEFSKGHVTVKDGVVSVGKTAWITAGSTDAMSGAERSYLIAGNLAAAFHNQGRESWRAYVGTDGYVYMGSQPICLPNGGEPGAYALAAQLDQLLAGLGN